MRTIEVYRAQPMPGESSAPATIVIGPLMPRFPTASYVVDSELVFRNDAKALAAVLQATLPGGTLHRLLIELLARKQNLLIVPDN